MPIEAPTHTAIGSRAINSEFVICQNFVFRPANVDGFLWAWGLLRDTSRVLLDREMDSGVVEEIREALEVDGETRISDLHVWRVGRGQFACAASIVTHEPKEPAFYKSLLSVHEEIAHVTLEVNRCPG
jgi:Co/Zn/Cd efflux system component